MFNEMQVGRFNRFVQKLLSMKGPPSLPTVATDLQFVHGIDSGAENRYLQGWDLFGFALNIVGAAGQFSHFEVRNPANSNVMAVVTRCMFSTASAGADTAIVTQYRGATLDQPTSSNVVRNFDARGRARQTLIVSHNNGGNSTAIDGTANAIVNYNAINPTDYELFRAGDEVPLLPGDALDVINGVVAIGVRAGFWWRERSLEDSERA